ncbi:MAG TPA: PocR ligand-binding domain-containing protein, partial [Clostridiales bacterium]|nr:PocR ligand-binding domain-containing protein [Clostridiales bacterium]
MDKLKYAGLLEYLDFISKTYNMEICINDFTGFTMLEPDLMSVLQPYMIHKNKFCMYLKSNNQLWQKCIKNKKKILDKCNKEKQIFKGICPSGVEEYIVPILYDNMAIGFISVGIYSSNKRISEYLLRKKCLRYNLDFEKALDLYNSEYSSSCHSDQLIRSVFSILVQYFQELYIRHINSITYKHKQQNKQHQLSPQ